MAIQANNDATISDTLAGCLTDSIARHGVPGAVVTVLRDGDIDSVAAGHIEYGKPQRTSPETVFQIGSVTKVFTATIVMMLVDEGKIALDDLIVRFLPDLVSSNPVAYEDVSIRHLLSHTSGVDGDLLADTGDGDDAVARFMLKIAAVEKLYPAGGFLSYCNAGYIILGRILEVIEVKPWSQIIQDRLLAPLQLHSAVMSAKDVDPLRTAKGHELNSDGDVLVAEGAFSPRSNGPSGTTLGMTGTDLMALVRLHLAEGVTAEGKQLLARSSCEQMQSFQTRTPYSNRYTGWGLGLMLFGTDGNRVYGHDGGTAGQSTYLRIVPEAGFAVVVMANGGFSGRLFRDIAGPLLSEYANFAIPMPPQVSDRYSENIELYEGCYERYGQTINLHVEHDQLVGTLGGEYVGENPAEISISLTDKINAVCQLQGLPDNIEAYFLEFDTRQQPQFLHVTERAFKRRSVV